MNFVCFNFGNKYNNAYVDALYHMIFRYNKISRFICVTDRKRNVNKDIEQLIIYDDEYEGAWVKLHCFHDNELPYKFICLDLDIIIQRKFNFKELPEIIKDDSLRFVRPYWGWNEQKFYKINQQTNLNSSVMYVNKHLESWDRIRHDVCNYEWGKYYSMDRFIYNTLPDISRKFFWNISFYSYYHQKNAGCEQKDKDVCLVNDSESNFFINRANDHWVFKYYPIHLSYPSTYHID